MPQTALLLGCVALPALGCDIIGASTGRVDAQLLVLDQDRRPVPGATVSGYGNGSTDDHGIWQAGLKAGYGCKENAFSANTWIDADATLVVSKYGCQSRTVRIDYHRAYAGIVSIRDAEAMVFKTVVLDPAARKTER